MPTRKYRRTSDKGQPTHFECAKQKCKWMGTYDQKAYKPRGNGFTDHVCPECGNLEFYGLTEEYVKSKKL
ncbi:hypothetical protein KORDIASMS9_02692 [Kordia sp. SMS9]|uniref:hypothetical protein n=1 Tax=Kordia sp. SMS9 TaxID=2282170 RepID=UPI000E0D36FD|nr:hypothetical protein [Kordia sp. SMS9]AXG70452.1 hypothetical protein KORDIASMS9_02692 [Kordia sp. SMS9]